MLSGDHIYKMDYSPHGAAAPGRAWARACTISVMEVPWAEACRFGIMSRGRKRPRSPEFAEKPQASRRATWPPWASTSFSWSRLLRRYLDAPTRRTPTSENDFGKNVIPAMLAAGEKMAAYRFAGYWKDVGTLGSPCGREHGYARRRDAGLDLLEPATGRSTAADHLPARRRSSGKEARRGATAPSPGASDVRGDRARNSAS